MNAVAVILKILKFCQFWFRQIEDGFRFELWQWSNHLGDIDQTT